MRALPTDEWIMNGKDKKILIIITDNDIEEKKNVKGLLSKILGRFSMNGMVFVRLIHNNK